MLEIRALVVDDEPPARRGIRQLAAKHADVSVVGECKNGREALAALDALSPNLVFLDVQMPELDGFGVIRERGVVRMPATVFVTAYDEFAVKAFDVRAVDYLVKPVVGARFDETLTRVRERLAGAEVIGVHRQLASLIDWSERGFRDPGHTAGQGPSTRPVDRLSVSTTRGQLLLDFTEIRWISADDYYASVHVAGARHLIHETMATLERVLSSDFVRVHRSAIVNLRYVREVRSVRGRESIIVLTDGTRVPVSRRRRAVLDALLPKVSR
jgi:two-component system LytT family response regulator